MTFYINATRRSDQISERVPVPAHFTVEAKSRRAAERAAKAECKRQGWRYLDTYTPDEWHAAGIVQVTLSEAQIEQFQ